MTHLEWTPVSTSNGQPIGPMCWDGDPEQPYVPGAGDDGEGGWEWVSENLARDHARALRVSFDIGNPYAPDGGTP